ncbi:ATP-grasp domain-containing protein [Vibrio crassostreae]|uniref:ATP-grasp domain-containing protein n=1 Tax=Vibrio crassostreae TaxID=246167 RepID=UPI00104B8D4C|nr:ATP-grasp domain-containing protein [Vibrio crassostreae]TCV26776.1 carbamoyl-phosphate synthase large subunit [Vibrio crassostreae]
MCNKVKVLMTGAGAPGGPGILKALLMEPTISLQVADINPLASGILLHNKSHLIPKADEPSFIDEILKLCISENIDVLFPLVTKELFKLSKNKELFESNGIKVLSSDYQTMKVLNDKGALLEHMKRNDLPIPDFIMANSKNELENSVIELGYPTNPVVIKPARGNGSRGIRILDPSVDKYDLLFNHKPNSIYSSLDFVLQSIGDNKIPEMVVSEFLPGDELTIDTVISNGEIIEILIRTRDEMRSGISISGRFIQDESIKKYIQDIISTFDKNSFEGAIGFQVKKSSRGQYLILESNPRIQGTSVAGIGCGVNLPVLAVFSALGKRISYNKKNGIGFCRYYKEVFYEQ